MKIRHPHPPPQMGPIGDPDWLIRYARLVEGLGFRVDLGHRPCPDVHPVRLDYP
ncbi:MAG: hypothetical protein R3F21_25750 [Myxococcota bacterium]